jgi:hypothetical protein
VRSSMNVSLHMVFTYSSLRLHTMPYYYALVFVLARAGSMGVRGAMRNSAAMGRDLAVLGGYAAAPAVRAGDGSAGEPPATLIRPANRGQ